MNTQLNEARELEVKLTQADYRYWILHDPDISDTEYDAMVCRLGRIDPYSPYLERLGTPEVLSNGKVKHAAPMLSLQKAYNTGAILKWAEKVSRSPEEQFIVMPKYDGVALNVSPDGTLSTRGRDGGYTGEDVSDKRPYITFLTSLNKRIPFHPGGSVRGELVIMMNEFERYAEREGAKHPRNVASGFLALKEVPGGYPWRPVFVPYDLLFMTCGLSDLGACISSFQRECAAYKFPLDGMVIRVLHGDHFNALGNTAHHPRGAIALKFKNEGAWTTLKDIKVQVAPSGTLTPVGVLEPVFVGSEDGGCVISQATLHNFDIIRARDIRIGGKVLVERAGGSTPKVVRAHNGWGPNPYIPPTVCPECGTHLLKEGARTYCPNHGGGR